MQQAAPLYRCTRGKRRFSLAPEPGFDIGQSAGASGLSQVHINPDGSLDGLNELHEEYSAEAGITLIAQLLELLVTFIGENLTVRLVLDVWPDLTFDDTNSGETKRK